MPKGKSYLDNAPPSWIYLRPYIVATNDDRGYPAKVPSTSGKWLIYRKIGLPLDDLWEQVKMALFAGKLGSVAKVSTNYPNPRAFKRDEGVICVYTYNFEDEADRLCIREALKNDCGVTWPIGWKLDRDTHAGKYAIHGDTHLLRDWR